MTLSRLMLSNIKGLRRKYAGFFACSLLAVILFYMLGAFILHPDFKNGYIPQAQAIRPGIFVAECIIVTFLVVFVLYSSSAFVKSRKKEFGLLCLLGASKSQIARLILFEHAIVGALSVAAGLGIGIPASKVMLDAMTKMLLVPSPIRFMVVVPAVNATIGVFIPLFLVIGLVTTFQISPRKVVRLLREHQRPKALPTYSTVVAVIGVLCIAAGYGVAWVVDGGTLVLAMLPVTAIVSLGTYLIFSQASVAVLRGLQKKLSIFYRKTNLLLLGDLTFRMKENSMVLATVAVLSACVITMTGTIYTAQATLISDEEYAYPHSLTFAVNETEIGHAGEAVQRAVSDGRIEITDKVVLSGLLGSLDGNDGTLIIPEQVYNDWATSTGRDKVLLQKNQATILMQYGIPDDSYAQQVMATVTYDEKSYDLQAFRRTFPRTNPQIEIWQFVVIDDALFEDMFSSAKPADKLAFFSYEFSNWKNSLEACREIRSAVSGDGLFGFASRIENYWARRGTSSLISMIALSVTALFFIACGSMLYFRMFGEIDEDRAKYKAMHKLGVSNSEVNRVVTAQILTVFFVPIAVGSMHCMFAMKALSNVLHQANWPFLGVFRYAIASIAGFSAVQTLFFLAARQAYTKEVGSVQST